MSFINDIFNNLNKVIVYLFLVLWVLVIVYVTTRMGYVMGIAASLAPLMLLLFGALVQFPYWSFIFLFIANYLVMGFTRYVNVISPGIAIDVIIGLTFAVFFFNSYKNKSSIKLSNSFNTLTLLAFVWFVYCSLQVLNPNSSSIIAWLTGVRALGVYFIIIVFFTAIVMVKFKDLKNLLFLWAILSLMAVLKAFIQKTFGFDSVELRWLFVEGGSKTHVLYYGIRYFSFFSDAGNFGSGIAFSGVVFGIISFYFKDPRLKVFYFLVALACAYGMIISGTRGSLAVPFVAFTVFVLLSKDFKKILLISIILILGFIFLNNTNYGQGNSYIRRMRSAFNPDDASLRVRVENQKILRTYLWNKPFGVGIAMSREGATTYRPDPLVSKIPSDSWYVRVWMEVGIVGLILHVLILLYIIFHGAYLVLFKLKNNLLKGIISALVCGLSGVYVSAYSLELIGQFPTSIIMFTCMAFIFLSPMYDKELKETEMKNINSYEPIS